MKTKKILILLLVFAGLSFTNAFAGGKIKITFKYKFAHIVSGYDHNSRMKVYIDGSLAGTSKEGLESKANKLTVSTTKGFHSIKAVMETEYQGSWEEHTIANEYSIDCLYEKAMDFAKNLNITLTFDIDSGTIVK